MTYILAVCVVALFVMLLGMDAKLRKQNDWLKALTLHVGEKHDDVITLRNTGGVWQ